MVTAKFYLDSIKDSTVCWSNDPLAPIKALSFSAVYDSKTPEDERFMKATPWGTIEMHVDNPAALKQFTVGKTYYLDFTPAEE